MLDWKIELGSKITGVYLVGKSGKERRVSVHCAKSDQNNIAKLIRLNLFPLYNGSDKGSAWRADKVFFDVDCHAGAVELRDKIRAVMDEYATYVNGTSGTQANGNPTKDDPETPTPDNPDPDEDKDYSSIVKLIIIAVLLYLILSYWFKK